MQQQDQVVSASFPASCGVPAPYASPPTIELHTFRAQCFPLAACGQRFKLKTSLQASGCMNAFRALLEMDVPSLDLLSPPWLTMKGAPSDLPPQTSLCAWGCRCSQFLFVAPPCFVERCSGCPHSNPGSFRSEGLCSGVPTKRLLQQVSCCSSLVLGSRTLSPISGVFSQEVGSHTPTPCRF